MFITPGTCCEMCGKAFKEGDVIHVIQGGTLERIGGLGLMRDLLTLKTKQKIVHEDCDA